MVIWIWWILFTGLVSSENFLHADCGIQCIYSRIVIILNQSKAFLKNKTNYLIASKKNKILISNFYYKKHLTNLINEKNVFLTTTTIELVEFLVMCKSSITLLFRSGFNEFSTILYTSRFLSDGPKHFLMPTFF